jgi:hypothetical protein
LVAALAVGVLVPFTGTHGGLSILVAVFLALAVVGTLFALPLRYLPAITLLAALLVPTELSLFPRELQGASLGIVPLVVWTIRAPRSAKIPVGLRLFALTFAVWLVLCLSFEPLRTNKGVEWFVSVGMALVFSILSTPEGLRSDAFRPLFLKVTTVLGAYAILEGFVLHHNPLFGTLLQHTSWWASQTRSASYRATTLLGHPLVNGLVFSTAAVLAASDLAQRSRRTLPSLVRFLVLVGATDATHSRGATIALGVGVLVVIIFSRSLGRTGAARRLVLAMSLIVAALVLVYGLQAREESRGGQVSAQIRVAVIKRATEVVKRVGPFGAGPGESEAYRRAQRLPGWEQDLENSYAQLAVSLGPIGALLFTCLLLSVVAYGLRNDAVTGETAALIALLIDISGFNAIEGHTNVTILISLLVIAVVSTPRPRPYARGDLASTPPQLAFPPAHPV